MLSGLNAYGDDSHSEGDDCPPSTSKGVAHHDLPSKHATDTAPGSLRPSGPSKAQVVIKRPVHPKPRPRPRFEDGTESVANVSQATTPDFPALLGALSTDDPLEPPDEVVHMRSLLEPPSIPELDNWGIPPEPEGKCDPSIEEKLKQFHSLKQDPSNPKHFNDSLMSNRSFRNPHLYAKLVEFVDVDERTTNFPREIWDPQDVHPEWFADQIARYQKTRSEQEASMQAQNVGKRTRLEFTAPKSQIAYAASSRHVDAGGKRSRFQPYDIGPPNRGHSSSKWGQ